MRLVVLLLAASLLVGSIAQAKAGGMATCKRSDIPLIFTCCAAIVLAIGLLCASLQV